MRLAESNTETKTDNIIEEKITAEVQSGDADVEYANAVQDADGTWTFIVTVKHEDTGWDNYADGWDVIADGVVVKKRSDPFTRLITHPHVNEQPFTRSQSGLVIPADVEQVVVRAHDNVQGYGGKEVIVDLRKNRGENFRAERKLNTS